MIAEDVKHGDGLICSFPACRNKGVKFLYCSYCRDPVAKRNFRMKHNHSEGEEGNGNALKEKESFSRNYESSGDDVDANEETVPITATVVSSSSHQISMVSESLSRSMPSHGSKRPIGEMTGSLHVDDMIVKKLAKIDLKRQDAWETLLRSRPLTEDGDEMSSWLMQVLCVSDLKMPLQDASASAGKSSIDAEESTNESSIDSCENYSSTKSSKSTEAGLSSSTGQTSCMSSSGVLSSQSEGSSRNSSNDSSSENQDQGNDSSSETLGATDT